MMQFWFNPHSSILLLLSKADCNEVILIAFQKIALISVFATTKLADKKVGGGAVKEINVLITAPGGEEVLNGQGEGRTRE